MDKHLTKTGGWATQPSEQKLILQKHFSTEIYNYL